MHYCIDIYDLETLLSLHHFHQTFVLTCVVIVEAIAKYFYLYDNMYQIVDLFFICQLFRQPMF